MLATYIFRMKLFKIRSVPCHVVSAERCMLKKEKLELIFLVSVIGQHLRFLMNVFKTPFLQTCKDGEGKVLLAMLWQRTEETTEGQARETQDVIPGSANI